MRNTPGIVTFAETASQPTGTEGRARIAALEKENAQMRAAQRTRQANPQEVIPKLRDKLPQVGKRSPSEIDANQKLDDAIRAALWTWCKQAKNMYQLLKVPTDTEFTWEEVYLAGWIHEYAAQADLTFKSAMEQIFDYLKRYPKSLESYTNSDANFAEFAEGGVSFAAPRGWSVDPQRMEVLRRIRVYQAGHPGCEFANAVALAGVR